MNNMASNKQIKELASILWDVIADVHVEDEDMSAWRCKHLDRVKELMDSLDAEDPRSDWKKLKDDYPMGS